jgi:signal transduction histidine kinase/CheY-like chemotaxis protein/HPt (histidine-containing phosphotransfer) domain-containing protein
MTSLFSMAHHFYGFKPENVGTNKPGGGVRRQRLARDLLPTIAKAMRHSDMILPRMMRRILAWLSTERGVTCLIMASVVAIGGSVFAWRQMNEGDQAQSRLDAAVTQNIAVLMEEIDVTLQSAIGGRQSVASLTLSEPERSALLFERTPQYRYINFIDVLNADGVILAKMPERQEPSEWWNRDYFVALRKAPSNTLFIGQPFGHSPEGFAYFPVSRRLTGSDGTFAGVVVMSVKLAYLRELLSNLKPGPHDSVTLLRDDGTILMRLPFNPNSAGSLVDAGIPFREFMQSGATPITARDPIDRVERRFEFHRVGTLPLVVSVGIATDESNTFWWLVPAAIVVGAVIIVLMYRNRRERLRRETAEHESREKSRFLTTLSHELRTPLHGVLGYADQLSREATLNPAQTHQVAEIVRAGKHMRDVVNVVLDYARIEALGPVLHRRQVDVLNLAQDCIAVVEPGARARGLETRVTLAPAAPAHFVADEIQLRQIMVNLLSNAVKYTPGGSVELRISGDETQLTFEVVDTGIGIPEGQRHHLFKEFERFGAERSNIEGTGLGLAISHRLSRRMGGHMGHRDNPGGGSVFWLTLPAGVADEADVVVEAEAITPQGPLNVLVVDDSEVNRAVAAAYLRKAGHTATEARDGIEAVQLVAETDFDVVLMDMRMSGMDGLEATRRIRALGGARAQVPIVAVTANALDLHAEECRRAGMSEHLAKPFTQAELLAVTTRAAARRPRASSDALPTIDADCMATLASCMGLDALHELLDCLALRIEALLRVLDEPAPFAAAANLAELAHELVGSAGTLGFARLSAIASRFQTAITANPAEATRMVAELQREAEVAVAELRRSRAHGDLTPA